MDNDRVIEKLSEGLELPQDSVKMLMESWVKLMKEHAEALDTVSFTGFGSFESRIRIEKEALHPASGKRLLVPPKVILNFKPSQLLKIKIKDGK